MILLYHMAEPLTSRAIVLPVVVDGDRRPQSVDNSFSYSSLGETHKGRENECIHFQFDYTRPNSSIDEEWCDYGEGIYEWSYQNTHYRFSCSGGSVTLVTDNPPGSYWIRSTVHAVFLSVENNGGLYSHLFYDWYGAQGQHSSMESYSSSYSIFGRWPGFNGNLFSSSWPSVFPGEIPELTDDAKNAIIDSVRRELSDRLNSTPPTSEVFRSAVNSIGNNMNSIANLLEGVDFVRDLLSFKVVDLIDDLKKVNPKHIKDTLTSAWMGYRYSYSTTKADIEAMTDYLLSYIDPNDFTNLKRYASETNEFGTTRCKVVFSSGDPINSTLRTLETTGLMLNAYAAWDMVPLSFVVDWFLPIGDFLEDLSSNWVSQPSVFNFSEIMFSVKTRLDDPDRGIRGKAYKRWISDGPPPFESYSSNPSTGTIVKRIFDSLCLTIP